MNFNIEEDKNVAEHRKSVRYLAGTAGLTLFEVLLYISLFALLCGMLSVITIQAFRYISDSKEKVARFTASYFINTYIQYFADMSESVYTVSHSNHNDIIVFENDVGGFLKYVSLSEIRRLTKTILDIESVEFQIYGKNNYKYIEVAYTLSNTSCNKSKKEIKLASCVEKVSINLI
jgi:hypothetical protein